ncbi:AraC family transcriptional regulator [Chryseobacterium sp.]|uniref:helix-turn-helix domain-containing protein n=1 Tax=Chryseobacterium sp. TaxID=1871047 RepID=UPI0025C47E9A|nr:AraC family transcriptional regulator [Chryseobacterium sp.]
MNYNLVIYVKYHHKIRAVFKAHFYSTITDHISELRMLRTKKLIINKDIMIKEIAIECGYEYVQNFTRHLRKSPEYHRKP